MLESIGVTNPILPDENNPQPGYFQETMRQVIRLGNTCQIQ
jgi:hypothetical protein